MANNSERPQLRRELLYLAWFLAGFGLCYAIFVMKISILPKTGEVSSLGSPNTSAENSFITTVTYQETGFQPPSVTIAKGNYIVIKNVSPVKTMWLNAEIPELSTARAYAESEQVRAMLTREGEFTVANNLELAHKLHVTVR